MRQELKTQVAWPREVQRESKKGKQRLNQNLPEIARRAKNQTLHVYAF